MNPFAAFFTRPDFWPGAWPDRIPDPPAAATGEEYTYRNPYPPPAGRRVRNSFGTVYEITPSGHARIDNEDDPQQAADVRWGDLLARGPVELVPLTDGERASEATYGPVGARWGTPGTRCAYVGCVLYVGHIGPHYDDADTPLGVTDKADRIYVDAPRGSMLRRICTCGNHAQHQPGCDRYVAPPEDDPPHVTTAQLVAINTYVCLSDDGDGNICSLFKDHDGPHDDRLTAEQWWLAAQVHELPNGDAVIGTPEVRDQAAADLALIMPEASPEAPLPRKQAGRKAPTTPTVGRKRTPRKNPSW